MSGEGGGGSRGAGGGGTGGADCIEIIAQTILNSPDPEVIETLEVGNVLSVVLSLDGGPRVLVQKGALVAGSITFGQLASLIRCIREGFEFIAIVVRIQGGSCRVEIRPKSEL